MTFLNRFFDQFDRVRERASWRAVFGDPQVHGDVTVVPVSTVMYGYGVGLDVEDVGRSKEEIEAEGGASGGGGGAVSRPVAIIEITPSGARIRPVLEYWIIIPAALLTMAWIVFLWTGVIRRYLQLKGAAQADAHD